MADTVQSGEQRVLFDIIDKLRSQGISQYVYLPEIIVCGDQSSGKSSVLEAISGMSFPTKDNLCTRFATELVLRRTPSTTSCSVSIIPDPKRAQKEKDELKSFDKTIDSAELNLGDVVESAKDMMGLSESKRFSNDILRIELGGPQQPHLTLVDLPGLFYAGNQDQSISDAADVKKMVLEYMKRPRSIILAVVAAKNEFVNQQVTKLTKKFDPHGIRTMGLITKPDMLHKGSGSEDGYLKHARNEDVKFQLGWHVLRNRDFPELGSSRAERDAAEELFFQELPWSELDKSQLGVATLKPRLSKVLTEQILIQLPGLLEDVEKGIKDCENCLQLLGSPRGGLPDQKRYLYAVSDGFRRLMDHAVEGTYRDAFFGDAKTEPGEARRLRAVVQNRFTRLSDAMREEGRNRKIIDTDGTVEGCMSISRSDYIQEVNDLVKRSRGTELPGTFNPLIIGDLFAEQCKGWKAMALRCLEYILDATDELILDVLREVAASETRDSIASKVNDELAAIKVNLKSKTKEILHNHTNGHPITYNHYLTDEVQKVQSTRRAEEMEKVFTNYFDEDKKIPKSERHACYWKTLLKTVSEHVEVNMENYASSLAVDYSEAYFKVSSKRFIDDLAVLSVERCLMSKVSNLFSRDMIDELDEKEIMELARESPGTAESRAQYMAKLEVLQAGLEDLKKLNRHRTGRFRIGGGARMNNGLQNGDNSENSDNDTESELEAGGSSYGGPDGTDGTGEEVMPPQQQELARKEKRALRKGLQPNRHFEGATLPE